MVLNTEYNKYGFHFLSVAFMVPTSLIVHSATIPLVCIASVGMKRILSWLDSDRCLHDSGVRSKRIMNLLHALDTFVRVVETGSFSAVARETNVNVSAVTRLVAQLEEHFKVRLFHRTTRHLSLTEDGQELLDRARQIIDATAELEDTLRHQRSTPTGRVRLGLTAARLITSGLPGLLR